MKFRYVRRIFVMSAFMLMSISVSAYAQTNIAVVDVEAILAQSSAAKSIKKQVNKKRDGFLAQVKAEEEKLRNEQKAIESKFADMSQEERQKKAQEFEKRRLEARNTIQKKKANLDKSYSTAMNTLTKVIFEVCQELANERKIDLVITKQNIIVGNQSLNITGDVMNRMNKKLPNLTLQ